jgi:hypothetical protein
MKQSTVSRFFFAVFFVFLGIVSFLLVPVNMASAQENQLVEQDFKGMPDLEWGLGVDKIKEFLGLKKITYKESEPSGDRVRATAIQYRDSLFLGSGLFTVSIDSVLGLYLIEILSEGIQYIYAFDLLNARLPVPAKTCGCDPTKEFSWRFPTTDVSLYSRQPEQPGVRIAYRSNQLTELRAKLAKPNSN